MAPKKIRVRLPKLIERTVWQDLPSFEVAIAAEVVFNGFVFKACFVRSGPEDFHRFICYLGANPIAGDEGNFIHQIPPENVVELKVILNFSIEIFASSVPRTEFCCSQDPKYQNTLTHPLNLLTVSIVNLSP